MSKEDFEKLGFNLSELESIIFGINIFRDGTCSQMGCDVTCSPGCASCNPGCEGGGIKSKDRPV